MDGHASLVLDTSALLGRDKKGVVFQLVAILRQQEFRCDLNKQKEEQGGKQLAHPFGDRKIICRNKRSHRKNKKHKAKNLCLAGFPFGNTGIALIHNLISKRLTTSRKALPERVIGNPFSFNRALRRALASAVPE